MFSLITHFPTLGNPISPHRYDCVKKIGFCSLIWGGGTDFSEEVIKKSFILMSIFPQASIIIPSVFLQKYILL